ncbi:c-type cytochrome biogenesis protein CcmI [Gilvimarinus agarilyticus]|uniref:c-type cytochrome biogenesis protein CcmI n=1 Tax=Gilvimarinus agarilyticus TaxID=679259 RepID=UPI00059F716F|nr:c-type cytochrome biogenesis protein CcmI [Gilvimarinus agarilyticus]
MSEFLLAAGAALFLVALIFIWPVWRAKRLSGLVFAPQSGNDQRSSENLALYREHTAELDNELRLGRIDQAQYDRLATELQRNFLADQKGEGERPLHQRGGAILLAALALLVLASGWMYLNQGSSGDVLFAQMQQQLERDNMALMRAGEVPGAEPTRELVAAIEARLKNQPDNAQYWYLLGRYGSQIGDFDAAERGFREVYQRAPADPGNASALAQAIFLGNGNQINGEITFLVERALELDGEDTTALGLAGISAFEQQQFAEAAKLWGTAVNLTPEGAPGRQALMAGVVRAREEAQQRGQSTDSDATQTSETSTSGEASWTIPVAITLAPDLQVPEGSTLFLYAREYQGSPMPLVVTRLPAAQFPATIVLDETMAMTSADRLFAKGQVEIVARVSASGQVTPAAGDLQGLRGPLAIDDLPNPVEVVIDTQL